MKLTPAPLLLNRSDVAALLTMEDAIRVVESAFLAHALGHTLAPGLMHTHADQGEFHIKAGGLCDASGAGTYFAAKINAGFFQNRARYDLPNIQGLLVLYDAQNGVPLAVSEAGLITALRTGAATAVAAKYLARPNASKLTLCGVGTQGAVQLRALKCVLELETVLVWSRDFSRAQTFAEAMRLELGMDVRAEIDLGKATLQSDVIVTCTPAKSAFLRREHVAAGTFIAAVGADSPDKQELEPALLAASVVVPDLLAQCAHVGDLHHALAAGLMRIEDVCGELGAIIAGQCKGRQNTQEIIVFDSTGTALQDVATLAHVYQRALAGNRGTRFAFSS